MDDLTLLEARALLSRAVNAAVNAGGSPLQVAMLMDSVKADLLIQVPYKALADQQSENKEQEEDADV